ncbi:uncharacterized protein LOC114757302 [Neltuma alba]|uniref:uncharacterized protein LOC114757302 n=1 Tax=Neltuma alba TaxID=207710 RepID=UPI0010A3C700|nr:uncharacterized protein LOC114757302 [Prosopis alba]
MAPNPNKANQLVGLYTKSSDQHAGPKDGLERTISDITSELNQQGLEDEGVAASPIWEVKNVKCECCGMSEECSEEYIKDVRRRFWGKFICGLCGEAVKETMQKNGGKGKEAMEEHINACVKFNKMVRSYPVLYQAEAIKQILKKASRSRSACRSVTPSREAAHNRSGSGTIVRSSSCIPAITRGTINNVAS